MAGCYENDLNIDCEVSDKMYTAIYAFIISVPYNLI